MDIKKTQALGNNKLLPLLISLSIPGIISFMVMTLYNIIDTFWVARLGKNPIAALTICFPIQMINVAIGVGSGIGITSLTSRLFGQKRNQETNVVAGQVYFLSTTLGIITGLIVILFPEQVLRVFGATEEIMPNAVIFLRITGFGIPFVYFIMMCNNLLRGSGDTLVPMIFMIIPSIVNAFLNPFLIFPELHIGSITIHGAGLGVAGSAITTLIAQLMGTIMYLIYLPVKSVYKVKLESLRPRWDYIYEIYRVGFPAMLQQFIGSITMIVYNHFLAIHGEVAIAAYGLLFRIYGLFGMPVMGIAQGLMPIVGFNFGAKSYKRMWNASWLAVFLASSVGLIGMFTIIWLSKPIVQLFTKELDLVNITVSALFWMSLTLPLLGPLVMWSTTFQGIGKGKDALILELSRTVLFVIPLLFLFHHIWQLNGIWVTAIYANSLALVMGGIWISREQKKYSKTVIEHN